MRNNNQPAVGVAFAILLFQLATGGTPTDPPRSRPAVFTTYQGNAATTKAEKDLVKEHCLAGAPKRTAGALLGPTRLIFRKAYVLESSLELRIPFWVCEHLTAADVQGKGRLKASFKPDPDLVRLPHAEPRDFPKSKFAQGHMAPDANRRDLDLKRETYFLSNIVPQAGQRFNSGIWLQLEKKVRAWTVARKECWIITGAFLHDPGEESPATADGLVDYFAIGKTPVGVPTHLFKIVVAKNEAKEWESLAFVFENKNYEPKQDLRHFLRSIEHIEERTGFNFFPEPNDELDIEALRPETAKELWAEPSQ